MKPVKSPKYLSWLRGRDCQVTGTPAFGSLPIIAHHITVDADRGVSQKPSDYRCISLRADVHMELHSQDEAQFWQKQEINPFSLVTSNLEAWIIGL